MPIQRCNQCGHTGEVLDTLPGTEVACPACAAHAPVYDTTFFVRRLLQQYGALHQEVKRLRSLQPDPAPASQDARPSSNLAELDLHNTSALAASAQHAPIVEWFRQRRIEARPVPEAVETSGFFDEIAVEIGDNYALLSEVVAKIRWGQRKEVPNFSLKLSDYSQKDGQIINAFCKRLYEHTFLAKYFYQKQEKVVRVTLQQAAPVRDFFAGEWVEWYVLMKALTLLQETRHTAACARNLDIVFDNEDLHELDVFMLVDGAKPVVVECKSGEFRQDIEKYLKLRKRLGIERSQFIIYSPELADEQAAALSNMYELTFANRERLTAHLRSLL
ncbi:MAG: hypothetical protein ABTQ28_21465 [Thauera sp.]|jgi:hypothetical protein